MKKLPIKLEKFTIKPNELVIFTLGNSDFSIIPTKEDMMKWKKLLRKAFPILKKRNWLLTPAVLKTQVFDKNKKHKVYLNNLEYLEYLSVKRER